MMKIKGLTIYLILLSLTLVTSCAKDDDDEDKTGDWVRQADFEGIPRSASFVFSVGDQAYVGAGFDGDDRLSDMWMYDGNKNTWYSMAPFPGKARSNAVAFTINGKGYAGSGYDGNVALKDFWEYTPETNSWKQISDLPTASGRYDAVGFSLLDKGYVGSGKDNDQKDQSDFYRYDAQTDTWEKIESLPIKRSGAFSFVIGSYGYIGGGTNNSLNTDNFYAYDPQSESWITKRDLNRSDDDDNSDDSDDDDYNLSRAYASSFVIGRDGYITGGVTSYALNDTWRYDVNQDKWFEVDAFEGANRQYAVSFSVKDKGFVATGANGTARYDDTWKFDPDLSDDD
jgi:N-acetylneuraminic acid mutarotase